MSGGMKFDDLKARYDLVPPDALRAVAEVLTFGALKYEPDNWKKVDQAQRRYLASAMRHVEAFRRGEQRDPDSRLHHLAHAATCLLFILQLLAEESHVPSFDSLSVQDRLAEVRDEYAAKRQEYLEAAAALKAPRVSDR